MSRTKSLAFWKASRKQIEGLPDIPAPLSEPAYANLLFFNHCHVRDYPHLVFHPMLTMILRIGLLEDYR